MVDHPRCAQLNHNKMNIQASFGLGFVRQAMQSRVIGGGYKSMKISFEPIKKVPITQLGFFDFWCFEGGNLGEN